MAGLPSPDNVEIYSVKLVDTAFKNKLILTATSSVIKYGIVYDTKIYSGDVNAGYSKIVAALTSSISDGNFTKKLQAAAPSDSPFK